MRSENFGDVRRRDRREISSRRPRAMAQRVLHCASPLKLRASRNEREVTASARTGRNDRVTWREAHGGSILRTWGAACCALTRGVRTVGVRKFEAIGPRARPSGLLGGQGGQVGGELVECGGEALVEGVQHRVEQLQLRFGGVEGTTHERESREVELFAQI
jgi:hypothetical protein